MFFPPGPGFFHLAHFQVCSRCSIRALFSWPRSTPLAGHTTFYSFSSSRTFVALAIMSNSAWSSEHKFFCRKLVLGIFLFLLDLFLGVNLLSHMETPHIRSEELAGCFPKRLLRSAANQLPTMVPFFQVLANTCHYPYCSRPDGCDLCLPSDK